MKREIKFRAWHKLNESMYHMGWNKRPNAEVFYTIGTLFALGEDAEFMQFTGLTDKNGVKIFEGDIIGLNDVICPITFENGSFQMITDINQGKSNAIQERVKHFEVIGNIYQNPELL